jgi:hypothetical protein
MNNDMSLQLIAHLSHAQKWYPRDKITYLELDSTKLKHGNTGDHSHILPPFYLDSNVSSWCNGPVWIHGLELDWVRLEPSNSKVAKQGGS